MSIDGFSPQQKEAFTGFNRQWAQRFYGYVERLAAAIHVEVDGIERLPEKRALLVANHGFGWDAIFPMSAIFSATGRTVWTLGEHLWWEIPFLRRLASAVGTVDGTQDNVNRLLGADQLVMVLPGGLREAVKPAVLRYRLLWGHRYGFIKAALRNDAPIVPVALLGGDELFDFMGNPYDRGRRWFRHPDWPIPLPQRILPIPHRVRFRYVIGEPLRLAGTAAQADDPEILRNARYLVKGALQDLIDTELARRAGLPI
jgi:1-acyl-sn-glycerol-3-phosphate acyltransferase